LSQRFVYSPKKLTPKPSASISLNGLGVSFFGLYPQLCGPLPAPSYQNRTLGLGPIWGPLGLGCSLRRGWLLLAMQHYISIALY
jgi:hypothetical protein